MKFVFNRIPQTVEEFKSMENFSLKTPHNTVALLMLALCRYIEDPQVGIEMINVLKGPEPLSYHDVKFHEDRLRDKPYLPKSYFEGATPANNYTPNQPLTIEVFDDPIHLAQPPYTRLFVASGGADSKRPVQCRSKGEDYFIWDYPGLLSGIRKPAEQDPWA